VSLPFPTPDDDPRYTKRGALYVPAGEGPSIWAAGDVYTIKATATQTGGLLGFIDASVPPGGGPDAHVHNDQDETFYLLSGELEFLDGDHAFTAHAGDFVHVPRGTRHRFKNKGVHPAKMIFLFTPGGPDEGFIDLFPKAVPGELPGPPTEEQIQRMMGMGTRTNTDILP
jgi:quercetin dioxygenase-like cupin family protein